ncbi:DNA replication/repair protein RecF [Alteriqipengyuania lutimaris]|uniref:DNA replication/repair protein RecF n=1 Tax=Alteriqipengyuania lutimaris TaxID=1538146 RepID=UPI001CFD5FFA|nr:DNA replication/repair protein RecF [Alteriqipengyuania lutimaris]
MALDRISILDFRNHRQTALEDTARFNLLVGANGAGKTNVLEALSLLAPGRGLRRAKLPEMARIDGPGGFTVAARLQPADGAEPVQLGTVVDAAQPNRRRVRVNGAERSALGLSEWLSVRWLTPAMDGLFTDSAGARRRYLDRLALATAPGHAALSNRYETALRNRNRLLSDDAPPDPQWLDALEAQLAEHGAAIAANRRALVEELNRELEVQADALFPRPLLAIEPTGPEEHTALADALRGNRRTERRAGRTLIGPHRAELAVTLADKGVPAARASTGEQKAMLIAITLAHGTLATRGRAGLLLLDEVAAHLDPQRREALFARLAANGEQVWMTGTERMPFDPILPEAAVWDVSGGSLRRI